MLLAHLEACRKFAGARIEEVMEEQSSELPHELNERSFCLEQQDWTPTPDMLNRIKGSGKVMPNFDREPFDPSLAALDAIVSKESFYGSTPAPRRGAATRVPRVSMPPMSPIPKYDAWIPVRTNYWAGKQLHVEPYMPFLGDQDDDCELAFEVYEDMADDAGKELDLSDGEVGKNGKFTLPKDDVERCEYYSVSQTRWREGSRKAILAVLDKFSRFDESMWRVLGAALGMKDIRRVKAIARVAQDRRHEKKATNSRRKKEREMTGAVRQARKHPREDKEMPADEEWSASINPLRLFCFTCHVFPCPQHAGMDVEPVIPVEDPQVTKREELFRLGKAQPCSKKCFLLESEKPQEEEWSAQEILLLREAVPIFGIDPCSLATVVGTRTCHEVSLKLDDPIEADIAEYEIQKARRPQRVEGAKKKTDLAQANNAKAKISAKTAVDKTDSAAATDQDFVPCYHDGPCTAETCPCVKKAMYCESTCGCNFGRYCQAGKCEGVVWTDPSNGSHRKRGRRDCQNRHFGCNCEDGNCDSSACTCWEHNRACTPDFCSCDCSILPQHIPIQKRRCHNLPASIAKHKKTYVGKSEVHGFGLFAGEPFDKGELVGVYSGQLIDTRLADMIGRLYDATDRTYIFNVTESLVIDGGLLGSKAKFCNHTKPGAAENCASKLVRVRGDAYVALFTKRKVETGEEFLFDYRFTGEVPAWALEDAGKGGKK